MAWTSAARSPSSEAALSSSSNPSQHPGMGICSRGACFSLGTAAWGEEPEAAGERADATASEAPGAGGVEEDSGDEEVLRQSSTAPTAMTRTKPAIAARGR